MPDWEMIVVDDGSTDDSVEAWNGYKDARIRVTQNEKNLGTYGTQNRCVELASTQLIAVLNSDDLWHPEKLQLQLKLMHQHPEFPLCYSLGNLINEGGVVDSNTDHHADLPRTEIQELFPFLLATNRVFASSVIFRRESAKFDTGVPYSGDWLALFHAAWKNPVLCVPERLTDWRIHESGTHQRQAGVAKEHIALRSAILKSSEKWLNARFDRELVRRKLVDCAMHLCADEVLFGRMHNARGAARIALQFGGGRGALRRYLGCYLPKEKVRLRMWPKSTQFLDKEQLMPLPEINLP